MPELNTTLGNGRFLLTRKLGVGGMGSVYEAVDSKRNVNVALKSLGQIDPLTVSSFKAEFRDFQHLHHPNLVVLDELFSEHDEWHFTMELLSGRDFLAHVRPRGTAATTDLPTEMASGDDASERAASSLRVYPGTLDIPALAETLRQLTAGLSHLHSAGKVHRDVKSSNVIITDEGRTVLLDFGVSVDIKGKGAQLAGTPLYMAPELFWQSATPAADWYSVGVLLYQALTGTDPWQGGGIAGLVTTKRPPPVHPSDIDFSIPEDLGDLCLSLLIANPRERAGRRAILEWIERTVHEPGEIDALDEEEPESEVFIGRSTELSLLRRAFDELPAREGPAVVYVHGESGIGKSALVEEFVKSARSAGQVTILAGRVLEEEVVPYKSVDGIIDSLCEYFLEIGYERVQHLLPEHFNIVADVFPVLRRSAKVAELPRTAIPDPSERRIFMFAALKECLRRVAERTNLVITLDDLQWSDADSVLLLNELVRGDNAPRMLLIATHRTERTASIRPSRRPPSIIPGGPTALPKLPIPTSSIWLPRLSDVESRAYLEARRTTLSDSIIPEDILQEASGHPLFIEELLRYRGQGIGAGDLTLEMVLVERISHLDANQRRYLLLTCIAAKPLPRVVYAKAASLTHGEGLRALKALRAGRLVRTGRAPGADGDDWVDAFHYRVRNAVLHDCDEAERASLHRAIATTMEAEGRLDPEQLALEWRYAGEPGRAAPYSESAADAAFAALAFQKAAEFYADALEGAEATANTMRLRERLARSLRNAGNGRAAADIFLDIARRAGPDEGFAFKCEAVELLLRSGYVDEALVEARELLHEVGEHMPEGNLESIGQLLWSRLRLLGKDRRWRPSRAGAYPADAMRRVDAIWSVSFGLGSVAQLPSFALLAKYLQLAYALGEPMRIARAFATEAMIAANGSSSNVPKLLASAREAATAAPDTPVPVVWSIAAMTSVMTGQWPQALEAARSAQTRIAAECAGSVGEWAMAAEAELWALAATGRFGELYQAVEAMRSRASNTRDLYATMAASSGLPNIAWVARDQPARAIAATTEITARWSQSGVHIQHLFDAYARAQALLYSEDATGAATVFQQFDARAKGKLLPVPIMMRVLRLDLEARIALALHIRVPSTPALAAFTKCVKRLRRLGIPWAAALATLLEAGAAHARRDHESAASLARDAASALARCGMDAHADAASAYADALRSPRQAGTARVLESHGVVRPEFFIVLLVPGWRLLAQN